MLRRVLAALVILSSSCVAAQAEDWPQWLGPKRDGVWREQGLADKFPEGGPKIRWRIPVGGGYSGPAVAAGKVYLTDRQVKRGGRGAGADRKALPGAERILCINEADGNILWSYEYDCPYNLSYSSGPRATPVVEGNRVYALGAEGHLTCMNIKTGKPVWQKKLSSETAPTPIWGFAGHPLIDGDRIIVLSSGHAATALNKHTGEIVWSAMPVQNRELGPGYAPPMIYNVGGTKQLVMWTPQVVFSLDPATGKEYWRQPIDPVTNGVAIASPMMKDGILLISSYYTGLLAMRMDPNAPRATILYKLGDPKGRKTQAIQTLMSTLVILDKHVYGICSRGELRCLDLMTGQRIWETTAPTTGGDPVDWTTAFIIPVNDTGRCFIANDQGELIIANLSPRGYEELSRAKVIEPTHRDARRPVVWCHPAFANRSVYWRNDQELVCVDASVP